MTGIRQLNIVQTKTDPSALKLSYRDLASLGSKELNIVSCFQVAIYYIKNISMIDAIARFKSV